MIKPITVRLLAYGQTANVAKIRHAAADLLKDEHNTVDASCFTEAAAIPTAETIRELLWDAEITLTKATKGQKAIHLSLPDVHERMTLEWLHELKVAKTCVLFAAWTSPNDGQEHQILATDGEQWHDHRDPAGT